jgi:transcription initiation factor TFIID TATA-box-binding protein
LDKPVIVDIVNVIATVNFGESTRIEQIIDKIPQAEYRPKEFSGVILRLTNPKASILIFDSGKMICTGTKSSSLAKKSIHEIASKFQKNNIISLDKPPKIKIQNIVASVSYGVEINLDACAQNLPTSMYEPEHFPAVIHKMTDPEATILLFNSGRVICTGVKTEKALYHAVTSLRQMLSMCGCLDESLDHKVDKKW